MKIWEDYYNILQVHYNAEQEVIEGAYKRLCKKYHPDVNKDKRAEEKIIEINRAYEVLKDVTLRREYHKEWLKKYNASFKYAEKKQWEWERGFAPVAEQGAQQILIDYIKALADNDFSRAYDMLSDYNKKHVTRQDFIQWREIISKIYAIGAFDIRVFNTYSNNRVKHMGYTKAIELEINMTEKNVQAGTVSQYRFTKIVAFENGRWKVHLEYDDLKILIHKFNYLFYSKLKPTAAQIYAQSQIIKDELTGFLNRKGFLEELEKEKNRFLRYISTYCVAVISIYDKENGCNITKSEDIKYAAYLIDQCIRKTDIAAYIEKGVFSLIYTETPYNQAKIALSKLERLLTESFTSYFKKNIKVFSGLHEHTGRDILETFNIACSLAEVDLSEDIDNYMDIRMEV
ncbi:MAG: DnaJ domain-containing protein [Clostridiales bacterium]|nr:DnaJ domain-containing protein [Clostridiales bacterium]